MHNSFLDPSKDFPPFFSVCLSSSLFVRCLLGVIVCGLESALEAGIPMLFEQHEHLGHLIRHTRGGALWLDTSIFPLLIKR